jgi:hypothetical protein
MEHLNNQLLNVLKFWFYLKYYFTKKTLITCMSIVYQKMILFHFIKNGTKNSSVKTLLFFDFSSPFFALDSPFLTVKTVNKNTG